jgi:hypothetical protein
MAYTDIDKPTDYFNTVTYSGTGSNQSITGVGFQPDWIWGKGRTLAGYDHRLVDIVRGNTKLLKSNSTDAEETQTTEIQSFDSDGFTVGTGVRFNNSSQTYVAWNWLASNTTASNTDGSITSTVSANTTAGFSIVSWTGNGSNGATIGHGLGTTPAIIITKRRNGTGDWLVGGSTVDTVRGGANSLLLLNGTNAMDSNSEVYQTFSSTTFQVGVNAYINTNSATMISYCFAEKKGFSKFGSYTGNGNADGTFIYTGFKPGFVLTKRTDTTNDWEIQDNTRSSFNVCNEGLYPNTSGTEGDADRYDLLSNGIKMRTSGGMNQSGGTYIYMAFAENPFVTSTGIPTTAR